MNPSSLFLFIAWPSCFYVKNASPIFIISKTHYYTRRSLLVYSIWWKLWSSNEIFNVWSCHNNLLSILIFDNFESNFFHNSVYVSLQTSYSRFSTIVINNFISRWFFNLKFVNFLIQTSLFDCFWKQVTVEYLDLFIECIARYIYDFHSVK